MIKDDGMTFKVNGRRVKHYEERMPREENEGENVILGWLLQQRAGRTPTHDSKKEALTGGNPRFVFSFPFNLTFNFCAICLF